MKLRDVRKLGIRHCEENNCKYVCISYDDVEEFYLTSKEDKHTVFFMNKNGSLKPCRNTQYAAEFHKELRKRKNRRNKSSKKQIAEAYNRDATSEDEG